MVGVLTPAYAQNSVAPDKMTEARAEDAKGDQAQQNREFESAAHHYEKALSYDRENAEIINKLGVAELRMNDHKQARKNFTKALKYNPQLSTAMNNLGVVDILDKKYNSAISYLKQSLALDEENPHTHVNLAEAWLGLGDVTRAMNEYTRALELDADVLSTGAGEAQAQVYTPEQRARIDYLIAKMYMQRNNPAGALDYLGRAKELNYRNLHDVYNDQTFAPLWKDPRLEKIVKQ
jgi:Tfp pilus assembly protein PilF